jgi:hypothetical protein
VLQAFYALVLYHFGSDHPDELDAKASDSILAIAQLKSNRE